MSKLEGIEARLRKLQVQAEAIAKKESDKAVAKIRQLMDEHGLTIADIDAHTAGKRRGAKLNGITRKSADAAKYRDPKTGATWTGRGRAPAWIAGAKDRTKFLADDAAAGAPVRGASRKNIAMKPGGRKPLPALYGDPETGATWTGRGRPPAWIAGAEDRTAFRI